MTDSAAHIEQLARAADRLRSAVLDDGTATAGEVRQAAYDGSVADPLLAGFVRTVRENSYRITDADVATLRDGGMSADAIFEVTVATALGAAQRRLQSGLALLTAEQER